MLTHECGGCYHLIAANISCPNKHGVHFPDLEEMLNINKFTICDTRTFDYLFTFSFLLKAAIGCSWNSFYRFLLVQIICQYEECNLNIVGFDLFVVDVNLLKAFLLFCVVDQHVSGRRLSSRIFL